MHAIVHDVFSAPRVMARGPRSKSRGPRALSVRRSVQLAMVTLMLIAGVILMLNQRAMTAAAYMLQRAEASYRQLDAYQQLSIDTLEYIVATPSTATDRRRRIEEELRGLDRLETLEVDLVRANGGDDNNLLERHRLGEIHAIVDDLFDARSSVTTASGVYTSRLKPLLDTAVNGEKPEIATVEGSMHEMQGMMRLFGWIGLLVQATVVTLVLAVVQRAVLLPLKRLVSDIRELGRGRLEHRVAVVRRDEFGLLAEHINRMARHLDHRTIELVGLNNALETTVAQRTRALQERNEELQEIDHSRRRFFVDVSHELRTPLTAIVGEADVTLRDPRAEAKTCRDALSSILANSTYLNRRIDDLMALARSSNGRLELELRTLDLNLIAADALAEVRSLAKVNQVHTLFRPLDREILVEGDRKRLQQCLMILLDNAVKFSPPSCGVEVLISIEMGAAALSVVDKGRGISADELPVVFERFYQTEVGRRMGGTGLGLAIARRIIEAHRGTIDATPAVGGGTAMTIRLPLMRGDEP